MSRYTTVKEVQFKDIIVTLYEDGAVQMYDLSTTTAAYLEREDVPEFIKFLQDNIQ